MKPKRILNLTINEFLLSITRGTLFVLMIISLSAFSQKEVSWDYPIKPGSEKWKTFLTGQEMVTACQIPNDILANLSTSELARICLNYPLFFLYTASTNEREAIVSMINEFNGLSELSQREDCLKELRKLYQNTSIVKHGDKKDNAQSAVYQMVFLELLLSNNIFSSNAHGRELEELEKVFLEKYNDKLQHQDVYSLYSISKSLLLGAVIYSKQDSLVHGRNLHMRKVKYFIDNYENANSTELTEISQILTSDEESK
ncbi:MAG: hypothetical protein ACK5JD_17245 [Mangrovibacterium sp.]